jgi:phage terminase small subunit
MPALLDKRHEAFAQHYCVHGHAGKAAAAVGLRAIRGAQLLRRPEVVKRIQELNAEQFAHVGVTAETIKGELARVAFASVRDLYDDEGNLLAPHELSDDVAATIAGIDVEVRKEASGTYGAPHREYQVVKVRRVDKMAALGLLARHFKIVGAEDDGVNALANALADRLNAAKRRINGADTPMVEEVNPADYRPLVTDSEPETIDALPNHSQQEHTHEDKLW